MQTLHCKPEVPSAIYFAEQQRRFKIASQRLNASPAKPVSYELQFLYKTLRILGSPKIPGESPAIED